VLLDVNGARISQTSFRMDTFYAHTTTSIEVPLDALLLPGSYTVRLALNDAPEGTKSSDAAMDLVVEAPALGPDAIDGAVPGLIGVTQHTGDGSVTLPLWAVLVGLGSMVGISAACIAAVRRSRRLPGASRN
jgi:hypothetical protein